MKPFIVFIALILVFTCLSICSDDMARYRQLNIALKEVSYEAARGGSVMNSYSFRDRTNVIDQKSADNYTKFIIKKAGETAVFSAGNLQASTTLSKDKKSITVIVTYSGINMPIFHFFGSGNDLISRKTTYSLVN